MLRKHHQDILALLGKMTSELDENTLVEKLPTLQEQLEELSSTLEEHLLIEDDFLYPALREWPQPDVRYLAHQFEIELGGLSDEFCAYREKWDTSEAITESPTEFFSETEQLLAALCNRINREDNELFPLLEKE